jgi:hypothetical protein
MIFLIYLYLFATTTTTTVQNPALPPPDWYPFVWIFLVSILLALLMTGWVGCLAGEVI